MDWRKVSRPKSWRSPSRQIRPGSNGGRPLAADGRTGSFDQWLDHRLKEMYGAVVEEPLPDELKDLVEKLSQEESDKETDRNK